MKTTEKDIELFDSYMNGTMSDTERAQFEARLQEDEAYRKEYELHSQLVLGIQRKELKAMLQEQEKQTDDTINVISEAAEARVAARRIPIGVWMVKLFVPLAAAACFFFGVFIVHDAWKMSSLGGDYIAQLEQPVPRGSGVEERIGNIRECLQKGDFNKSHNSGGDALTVYNAQDEIDKARQAIAEEKKIVYPTEEETEYHQQMLKLDSDELDWYQALLYAKTHKVFKAKRLLKQIAKSDSRYSEDAIELLK